MSKNIDLSAFDEEVSKVDTTEDKQIDLSVFDEPKTSTLESGLRGAFQGATLGFADEITGGVEALGKGVFGSDKLSDLVSNYEKYRDESRQAYKEAEETNPSAYLAGEVGGGIATSIAPIGLAVKGAGTLAKGASALGKLGATSSGAALSGAGLGAVQGAGMSEADNLKDLGTDVGISATAGGVFGAAGVPVSRAVSKGFSAAKGGLKSLSKKITGLSDEAFEEILTNPQAIESASGNMNTIVKDLKDTTQESLQRADEIAKNARSSLKAEPTIQVDSIINNITDDVLESFDDAGKNPVKKAINELNKKSSFSAITGRKVASEQDLQSTLDELYNIIYKKGGSSSVSSKQNLKNTARKISSAIKTSNPEYAEGMKQSSNLYDKVDEISNMLGLRESRVMKELPEGIDINSLPDELKTQLRQLDFGPNKRDALVSNLKKALKPEKEQFVEDISRLGKDVGLEGLDKRIITEATKSEFEKEKQAPLMIGRALAGTTGALLGQQYDSNFGGIGGAVLGGIFGPKAFKQAIIKGAVGSQAIKKGASKVMDATLGSSQRVANKLLGNSNPQVQEIGRKLADLADQPDSVKRAFLFSLSQQPSMRKLFEEADEDLDTLLQEE